MKNQKIYFFYGLLSISFLFLLARLFESQIIFGEKNRSLAEGNRIRKEILPAPRGIIYDRNDKELVRNVPIYRVKKQESKRAGGNEEWKVISREEALTMESKGETENLRMDIGRNYLYGKALAHVIGYLGEVNATETRENKFKPGDLVGRMGIEEQYDKILRGKEGGEIFEVDAHGRKIRQIGKTEPIPGKNIHLSLDAELSKIAYESLDNKLGAVVAAAANDGQILVLVSSPSFDPNIMVNRGEQENKKIGEFLSDPQKPFFNRAISGVYPPGSTFKIVVLVAGLEENKIDENTVWNDTGEIKIGAYSYKNWYFTEYGRVEGEVNLVKALKRSTDTFFYKAGEWIGPNLLVKWAKNFGLGQKTNIDLPGEASGLVPDPNFKDKKTGERWYLGNTYHLAIGQGDLLTTPLQINLMTTIIANDGKLCQPRVKEFTPRVHSEEQESKRAGECQDLKIKTETLRLVKEGMKEACATGGTAYPFFEFKPETACKTGTSEFGDPGGKTHAWFTAFAPLDKPEIIATAIIEGGGEGSAQAAPVVKKIMEAYFRD